MQTDTGRHRADTRLPRLIQKRPELDQEVYRRLVWGKDSSWIAWDLGLSEIEALQLSREIMDLLKKESPRVHRRIMANRRALQPSVSLDRSIRNDDGDEVQFEASDTRPLPDANFEQVYLLERLPSVELMIPRNSLQPTNVIFDYSSSSLIKAGHWPKSLNNRKRLHSRVSLRVIKSIIGLRAYYDK